MQKRILSLLLCLSLLLGLTAAMAEPVNVNLLQPDNDAGTYKYVTGAANIGDTVYVLTSNTLECWKPGDAAETVLTQGVMNSDYEGYDITAEDEANGKVAYSRLLTDGDTLYGFNRRTGTLWKLLDASGLLPTPELAVSLAWDSVLRKNVEYDYEYTPQFGDTLIMDGTLYAALQDWENSETSYEVMAWDLATGKQLSHNKGIALRTLNAYQDGLIIGKLYDDANSWDPVTETQKLPEVATFDPKTGEVKVLLQLPSANIAGVRYDAAKDTLYYVEGATVKSVTAFTLPAKVSAYLPNRVWEDAGMSLLPGGMCVIADYNGVIVRALDQPGIENGALTIYGEYGSAGHQAYIAQNPQALVTTNENYYSSLEEFTAAMVSGSDAVDVLRLNSGYTPLQRLVEKGYALDLSTYPELMALAGEMDANLAAPMMLEGKLYGVPVDLNASAIGVYQRVWDKLELTQEDKPTTFMEMLDFVDNWQDDYGEDHPEYMLTDDGSTRRSLLGWLMDAYYAEQVRAGEAVRFDTPLFRKLMERFDSIDFTQMEKDQEQQGDDYWSRESVFTLYANPTYPGQARYDSKILALPLDEGLLPVYPCNVDYLIINPRTTRTEQAVQYVSTYVQNMSSDSGNIVFFPGHNDGVINPRFESDLQNWKDELVEFQALLETAVPESVASLKETITYYEELINNADTYRYTVTAEEIQTYRDTIAPYLVVTGQSPLNTWDSNGSNEFYTLREQYLQGAMPLDTYIKEIDKRIRMISLEDQ